MGQNDYLVFERAMDALFPDNAKAFLDTIDKPGAIIALFDGGKIFYAYYEIYEALVRYVLNETEHITLRIGGCSSRLERGVLRMISKLPESKGKRVECLYCEESAPEEYFGIKMNAKFHLMREFVFSPDDPLVKYAEGYDYRSIMMHGEEHPLVYYYVNKIDPGWYDKDGKFFPFYGNGRGLKALVDVIMIRGYREIKPASAAVYIDSGDYHGNTIYFGTCAHHDKQTRAECHRKLFEDAGIPYFDIKSIEGASH